AACAVTSSPGASSAKPSTSKPHPTLETVAGANAVTLCATRVPLTDGRDEVVMKRALEIVPRIEAPVSARGGIVDVRRPRVDDRLPFLVFAERDRRARKRRKHAVTNLGR